VAKKIKKNRGYLLRLRILIQITKTKQKNTIQKSIEKQREVINNERYDGKQD
jgi:hypothetical protein